jgi:hypothetical protein
MRPTVELCIPNPTTAAPVDPAMIHSSTTTSSLIRLASYFALHAPYDLQYCAIVK